MSKTVIIGLTGPTGAGKTAARDIFEQYGCRFADCDVLSRRAVEPGSPALEQLSAEFGEDIILPDGALDRALLAQRAFPTPEGRERLNGIVHPAVIAMLEDIIRQAQEDNAAGVVIDAPLLFESGLDRRCDAVVAVVAPDDVRLARIMARDGLTEEAARTRMAAQHSCGFYSDRAQYVIDNSSTVGHLRSQTQQVLESILGKGGRS